jgi:dienelactone hydrolase
MRIASDGLPDRSAMVRARLFLLLSVSLAGCAAASPTPMNVETTGTVAFETWTPTIGQFLQGAAPGAPVTISGDLKLPAGTTARVPAMVIVHGAGGISQGEMQWARDILKIGVATFVIDSFTGRGIRETQTGQTNLPIVVSIVDAYRALALLGRHPRIDPARIGILGLSRGGGVSLYASLRRFQRMHAPPDLAFAVYVAFYPPCNTRYVGDEDVSDRPIRILHGEADDQTLFAACRDYVARLRQAGKNVEIVGYPGAHHSFDGVHARTDRTTRNFSQCRFDEAQPLADLNAYVASCVSRGVTRAYDARAHADAVRRVTALLSETFGSGR